MHMPKIPEQGASGPCVPTPGRPGHRVRPAALSTPLSTGSIPGPIAFGWVIDKACLLWQDQCGQPGSCFVYQNGAMSRYMLGMGLTYKVGRPGEGGVCLRGQAGLGGHWVQSPGLPPRSGSVDLGHGPSSTSPWCLPVGPLLSAVRPAVTARALPIGGQSTAHPHPAPSGPRLPWVPCSLTVLATQTPWPRPVQGQEIGSRAGLQPFMGTAG